VEEEIAALTALHVSLDQRPRPEDVAALVVKALPKKLGVRQRNMLRRVANTASRWHGETSMPSDFARPVGGARQVAAAERLFELSATGVDAEDPAALRTFAEEAGTPMGAALGRLDFLNDRLDRNSRSVAGIELSKRQYNRRFRLLRRIEAKASTLDNERRKRSLALVARAGQASSIGLGQFLADPDAACFVAYYTAKRKLRREFTLSGRDNSYDQIAELLFKRCLGNPATDWWMIAQAYPAPEVLHRISEARRGELLGRWFASMRQVGELLSEVWEASDFNRETMIVRAGNDSSTWNLFTGAYNTARAGWLSCLAGCEALDLLDVFCPGKSMLLIAGDLAAWHDRDGSGRHPDTGVWARLPLPWRVLDGREQCTRADVLTACAEAKVDAVKSGWVTPRPAGAVGWFRPTPELVHGVAVADPAWADLLRKAGVFSGKAVRVPPETGGQPPRR
jgi:hypothetical protein